MKTGALEFCCLDESAVGGTTNAVQTMASFMVTVAPSTKGCVDEHIDDSCDCGSDLQSEAVSKEKVCGKH